jgi:YD repeat-containing protein
MLIQKEEINKFFSKNEMPSDSVAIIAALTATSDTLGNINYKYTYDLSKLLTRQIRNKVQTEYLNFVLVPVAVTSNTSTGSIQSVKPLQTISATLIRSANNQETPMDIEMVYAGFSKTRQGQ